MTDRVYEILSSIYEQSTKNPDALVFGVRTSVKKAFATVKKRAGIPDLRFRDLRHVYCSRLVAAGIPPAEGARLSGHEQPSTRTGPLDSDKLIHAAIEQGKLPATVWKPEGRPVITPHP